MNPVPASKARDPPVRNDEQSSNTKKPPETTVAHASTTTTNNTIPRPPKAWRQVELNQLAWKDLLVKDETLETIQGVPAAQFRVSALRKLCSHLQVRGYKSQPKQEVLNLIARAKLKYQSGETTTATPRKPTSVLPTATALSEHDDDDDHDNKNDAASHKVEALAPTAPTVAAPTTSSRQDHTCLCQCLQTVFNDLLFSGPQQRLHNRKRPAREDSNSHDRKHIRVLVQEALHERTRLYQQEQQAMAQTRLLQLLQYEREHAPSSVNPAEHQRILQHLKQQSMEALNLTNTAESSQSNETSKKPSSVE